MELLLLQQARRTPQKGPTWRTPVCLAVPRKLPREYYQFVARRSVYYTDVLPLPVNSGNHTEFITSEWVDELSEPRLESEDFTRDRDSPIWPISEAALSLSDISVRLAELSQCKPLNRQYKFGRPCVKAVRSAALHATPTTRLQQLAVSNPHKVWPGTDGYLPTPVSEPVNEVSVAAKTRRRATIRLTELSEPVPLSSAYKHLRSLPPHVPAQALSFRASDRLKKLAQPIDHPDNNTRDPYLVDKHR